MKKLIMMAAVLNLAYGALAVDKADLDQKAKKLLAKFEAMQAKSDKCVPADILRKAQGIILLDRTKAGVVFAYQGGGGIAMVKDKKGKYGPLAFMKADEASLGFQVGGQQTFFVILLMNEQSAKSLTADSAFEFGGEAQGTAGEHSAGAEGKVEDVQRSVLVYDDRKGLFGGAAVKGGAISADNNANRVYYDKSVTMQEILFDKKVSPTEPATALAQAIDKFVAKGK
jgi:lipid-binding SYLF domain-containing protein